MAQPQPQPQPQPQAQAQVQPPPRAFSPPQPSPSPAASQSSFALPPQKRVRTDAPSSQPESPYATSPYAASPGATATPPAATGSPAYAQSPALPQPYATPYTNGHTTPGLNLPDVRPNSTPPVQQSQHQIPVPQYTNATMTPVPVPTPGSAMTPAPSPGVMGPPQRPAERPAKDYEYDVTDSLAGTGIDLRAEEQYMNDLYATGFDEARTGFAHQQPGPKASFYGAGPANQAAQSTQDQAQEQFAAQQAERAWSESSMRLALQRTQEISDPFLLVAMLHRRADKIAREHHLALNLDLKNNSQTMGKMRLPEQFPSPKVTVKVTPGPDSTMVHTTGSYIPHDAFLVDQLALMSIATKQRLRELVEDAHVVASNRQKTSHGDVPEDWLPAAAPMNAEPLEPIDKPADEINGVDGAPLENVNGDSTNPLKRSSDTAGLANGAPPVKLPKISSYMTTTMRDLARQERDWEEARLRKRQKRKDGIPDSGNTTSRAGSVAPGTPGGAAPEAPKAMTKKEMKKNQQLKAAEMDSHQSQNTTSSIFAGLGGKGGLFGKKKTGKTYDWMNVGRGGSGTSTPTRNASGPGKGPGGAGPAPAPANMAMTTEGRNRLGTWREDKEKGKNIQLRDWVAVLERDGREAKALQKAYLSLDASNPK
ncbi:hypothetical protein F66182_1827 [Fusarium sp. NRRL 66182]|nr:hypothetical protein F66182_1827 [Fusarium sp. NRRL 66182]